MPVGRAFRETRRYHVSSQCGARGAMRCSVCGHESPPGSSFCLNCGSALAPAVQLTPAPPAGLPAPVICTVCRGENPAGMKFCRSCGAALFVSLFFVLVFGVFGLGGGFGFLLVFA